uniref:Uncharacterized protein n=1 Tax=Arundo donax TaxID=35708 RepID=A0A0A9CJM0_ARUDO
MSGSSRRPDSTAVARETAWGFGTNGCGDLIWGLKAPAGVRGRSRW